MKRISVITVCALYCFLAPAYGAAAHFLLGSSLYNNLSALINQHVKLILKGGATTEGMVTGVGDTLLRLESPGGFESLVVIEEIAVLSVQKKPSP